MQVDIMQAFIVQGEITKEYQWLLSTVQHAPDELKPEIQAMADKRLAVLKAVEGEIAKATVSISEDAQKYIKREAVDTNGFTPIAK